MSQDIWDLALLQYDLVPNGHLQTFYTIQSARKCSLAYSFMSLYYITLFYYTQRIMDLQNDLLKVMGVDIWKDNTSSQGLHLQPEFPDDATAAEC